jgi:uncharacterized transporter YbjL
MKHNNRVRRLGEVAAFAGVGSASGAVVASMVGGMGLAIGGTAVAITAAPVVVAGSIVGLAAYGLRKAMQDD